jgi:protein phosphatase
MQNPFEPAQSPVARQMTVRLGALTDVGQLREHNEDNFLVCANLAEGNWFLVETPYPLSQAGTLLAVADGMGGENAGEVASALAVEAIKEFFSNLPATPGATAEQVTAWIRESILFAHGRIVEHGRHNPACEGMGTTILMAWVLGHTAYVGWSGDSRCYLYRPGEGLRILSDDHSVVWELVQSGRLNEEEAESHPESHIITQSLGDSRHPPRPDVLVQPLQPHDKLLLCSDGLNGMLNSEQISQIIGRSDPLGDLCKAFIDAANRQGGEDNITVVMLEVLTAGNGGTTPDAVPTPAAHPDFLVTKPNGTITPKTIRTLRRAPLPGAPTARQSRWLAAAGFGLVLVLLLALWTNGRGRPDVPPAGRSEAPTGRHQAEASAGNRQEVRPAAAPLTISEATLHDVTPPLLALLDRYRRTMKRIETLREKVEREGDATTAVPETAALASKAESLPGARALLVARDSAAAFDVLRRVINSQAHLDHLEGGMQALDEELELVEGRLRKIDDGQRK